jgi:GNAT superfamily N-acetyltransferase
MDRFAIRLAHVEDAQSIVNVQSHMWALTYADVMDENYLKSRAERENERVQKMKERLLSIETPIFVAEIDGDIVGFVSAGPECTGQFDAQIYSLYVHDQYHGIGIGQALFSRVSTLFHAQGKKSLIIWSLVENPYRGFYLRMGGKEVIKKRELIGNREFDNIAYLYEI